MSVLAVHADERGTTLAFVENETTVAMREHVPGSADGPALDALVADALRRDRTRRSTDVAGIAFALPDGPRWDRAVPGTRHWGLRSVRERALVAVLEGERLRRDADDRRLFDDAVLLDLHGPRAAFRLNGRPHAGRRGSAGDLRHLGIDRTGDRRCPCGLNGCLGVLLDDGDAAPEPPLPERFRPAPSRRLGWQAVAAVVLVNVFNPAVLVADGSGLPDSWLAWFADVVRAACLAPAGAGLSAVLFAHEDSVLLGAAARLAVPDA